MTDKSNTQKASGPAPMVIVLGEPEAGTLRHLAGSQSDRFNNALVTEMTRTCWFPAEKTEEDRAQQSFVAVTAMQAFKPQDEIEGLLAAQAMAMHHASLECSRRAMLHDQPFEAAQGLRKAAASASRTFTELLSALDRKRGRGAQQKVTVEHVHVHSGGQAIVGNLASGVTPGGGANKGRKEPHASRAGLAHDAAIGTVSPALRSPDAERQLVPIPGDAEWSMQDARRPQHGANNRRDRADPGGSDDSWTLQRGDGGAAAAGGRADAVSAEGDPGD